MWPHGALVCVCDTHFRALTHNKALPTGSPMALALHLIFNQIKTKQGGKKGVGAATLGFGVRVRTTARQFHTTKPGPPYPHCHLVLHMNGCGGLVLCITVMGKKFCAMRSLCCNS